MEEKVLMQFFLHHPGYGLVASYVLWLPPPHPLPLGILIIRVFLCYALRNFVFKTSPSPVLNKYSFPNLCQEPWSHQEQEQGLFE